MLTINVRITSILQYYYQQQPLACYQNGELCQTGSPATTWEYHQIDGGHSPWAAWGDRNDPCVPSPKRLEQT